MKKMVNLCLVLSLMALLFGCFSTTHTFRTRRIDDNPSIEKSNVIIDLTPISIAETYDYPEYFEISPSLFNGAYEYTASVFPKDLNGHQWYYMFERSNAGMTVFKVRIINNTEHILRMKDARIYLIEDEREPLKAIGDINELKDWITSIENNDSWSYAGFGARVIESNRRNYTLINDLNKEILPGFEYSGLLIFPTAPKPESINVKVAFFDITTKTDVAGNVLEKTKFEFPITNKAIDLYFDKENKRWKEGLPPVKGTE